MSSKRTKKNDLLTWLQDINEVPSVLSRFDIAELNELYLFIKDYKTERLTFITNYLIVNPTYLREWAYNNISQYGLTYNRLEYISALIQNRIKHLNNDLGKKRVLNRTNNKGVFKKDSEKLCKYIIENSEFELNRKNIGGLYFWLLPHLKCNKLKFAHFWNSQNLGYKINIRSQKSDADIPSIEVESISSELDSLKLGFDKITKS